MVRQILLLPDCECAHGIIRNYLMNVKFCDSEEDIQIVSPGIWVVKRKINDCDCYEKAYKSLSDRQEDDCKVWCDKTAFLGNTWCSTSFKDVKCQALCLVTVELLKDGCYLCCRGGDFYSNCVQPFKDILNAMGGKCNPDWNAK